MIKIVKGKFLWFDGRRRHVMTPDDGAFRADDALEARLVAEGVAEWADAEPEPAPEQQKPDHIITIKPTVKVEVEVDGEPEPDLADMTRAELAELAESYGIKPGKLTKAKLIAAIEEAEQAPSLAAAEVE